MPYEWLTKREKQVECHGQRKLVLRGGKKEEYEDFFFFLRERKNTKIKR